MMATKGMRRALKATAQLASAAVARGRAKTERAPRFCGAYDSREMALAALPKSKQAGYDDESVADVSFVQMCDRMSWDYPLIFWLERLLGDDNVVIDAGGHMGTKFIAFSDVLDLRKVAWTVYDLPGIVRAARDRQIAGDVPKEIEFVSDTNALPKADIVIASGLLQYLDVPFGAFVDALPQRPKHILLNKVALRDGPGIFTVERIGRARVPYQIRCRGDWMNEVSKTGYNIVDQWEIPDLGHVIATHPWHGRSESWGFLLTRSDEQGD